MASDSSISNSHLIKLIESLGTQLTHASPALRNSGLNSLVNYLGSHDAELWLSSGPVLIDFFLEKLSELECLPAALEGLSLLVHASPGSSVELLSRFVSLLAIHTLGQSLRLKSYQLLSLLVRKLAPPGALQLSHGMILPLLMSSMEGEKDPRNLGPFFLLVSEVNARLSWISPQIYEDWLGMVLCYFPITFTPPPNDPFKISPAELRAQLLDCMASFLPFERAAGSVPGAVDIDLLVPSLTEKLSASLPVLAIDVFAALSRLLPSYQWLLKNALELGNILLDEVWTCRHAELSRIGLEALSCIVQSLADRLGTGDIQRSSLQLSVPPAQHDTDFAITPIKSPLTEILLGFVAKIFSLLAAPDESDQKRQKERLNSVTSLVAMMTSCGEQTSQAMVIVIAQRIFDMYEKPETIADDWKIIVSCHIFAVLFRETACLQRHWGSVPDEWFLRLGSHWQQFLCARPTLERQLSVTKAFVSLGGLLTSARMILCSSLQTLFVDFLDRVREVAFNTLNVQQSAQLLSVGIQGFSSSHSEFVKDVMMPYWRAKWLQALLSGRYRAEWITFWSLLWTIDVLRASVYESIYHLIVTTWGGGDGGQSQDWHQHPSQRVFEITAALDLTLAVAHFISDAKFKELLSLENAEESAGLLSWISYSASLLSVADQSSLFECLVTRECVVKASVRESCFASFSPAVIPEDSKETLAQAALLALEQGSSGCEKWLASIFNKTCSGRLREFLLVQVRRLGLFRRRSTDLLLIWVLKALAYEANAEFGSLFVELEWRDGEYFEILLNEQRYAIYSAKKKTYYRQWLFSELLRYLETGHSDILHDLVFAMMKYFAPSIHAIESKRFLPLVLKVFYSFSLHKDIEENQILVLDRILDQLESPCSSLLDAVHRLLSICQRAQYSSVRLRAAQCLSLLSSLPVPLAKREMVIEQLGKCLDDPKRRARAEIVKARNIWILKHAGDTPTREGCQ